MATGIAVGISTFGAVNNSINAFYYNNISDGESDLEVGKEDIPYSERKGDYVDRYVSRWERLDYAKKPCKTIRITRMHRNSMASILYICICGMLLKIFEAKVFG